MKRLLLLNICFIFFTVSYSQQSILATSGDYFKNETSSISFTIGDLVVDSYLGTSFSITQGFQQSEKTITGIENISKYGLNINIYPNPTTDFVNINIDGDNLENISCILYDIKGQNLVQKPVNKGQLKLDLLQYSPSIYLLKIVKGTTTLHTFKFMKH